MYSVSDIIEVGEAREFIQGMIKDWFVMDDSFPFTMFPWEIDRDDDDPD